MRLFRKQLICIFFILSAAGCGTRSDLAPVTELKWQPYSKYQKFHTVRSGETLYAIAFRYDTDYRRLAINNHLRPPYSLRVGQVLSLKGIVPKSNHFHSAPRANLHITHKPKQKLFILQLIMYVLPLVGYGQLLVVLLQHSFLLRGKKA